MAYFKHETALVDSGAQIGDGTRIWAFVNIQKGVVIGKNCNICDHCFIEKNVIIGDKVTIKNGVSVYEGITLEEGVFVGPNATFVNDRYPRSRNPSWELEKSIVKKGATIGANSTIMCGVMVGSYAVVGAGAVVVTDVPAHAILVGNPARQIGWADQDGKRLNEQLQGPSGRRYHETPSGLQLIEGHVHG
ncbi:MAG: N-acetyltransferase [Candidatus Omnitrophica bacterium]|nr:N-acetyltransferase [Candidatus Omnitrophota bacterium]